MKKGIIYAAAAFIIWGFFPIYFKSMQSVPAFQIMTHRVVWSFIFLALLVARRHDLAALKAALTPRVTLIYLVAAVLLAINWFTYVWSVNAGFVVEGSLGYFINPLVNVLLGVLFLKEKLRPMQWAAIGLAAFGVAYLTFSYGVLPWIALVLAFSFGIYGMVKKVAPLNSLQGTTLETATLFLPALAYLVFMDTQGSGAFVRQGVGISVLLGISGILTSVPLLLFGSAARRVPLTTMGILQYLTPSLHFLLGVFLYNEPFTHGRMVGFSSIWIALLLLSAEGYIHLRKPAVVNVAP